MGKALGLIIGGTVIALIAGLVIWIFTTINLEQTLRQRGLAQQNVCKANFSKMWQILKDQAGVTAEYSEQNQKFVTALMEGRYSKGDGSLMKWIVEQNPTFDASLYKQLMTSIEAQRTEFFNEQTKLIDIDREHKTLRINYPGTWCLKGRPDIGIVVIEAQAGKNTYATGVEEEMDMFGKKAAKEEKIAAEKAEAEKGKKVK